MQRPDLRQITGNIREALADCDRDTLLDMLTFVFKEYVVEGPPPLLISQAERVPDLEGLSFGELIRTLQTRLELPELNLFQVDGAQVLVRVNGVLTPLDAGAARAQAMVQAAAGSTPAAPGTPATPAPPQAQQPPPRPVAGIQMVETNWTRVPARVSAPEPGAPPAPMGAPPAAAGQPPAPRRGLSVRGQPSEDVPSARPSMPSAPAAPAGRDAQPGSAQPQQQPAPASQQQPSQQPSQQPPGEAPRDAGPRGDRDSAAERFSLLELD